MARPGGKLLKIYGSTGFRRYRLSSILRVFYKKIENLSHNHTVILGFLL